MSYVQTYEVVAVPVHAAFALKIDSVRVFVPEHAAFLDVVVDPT